MTASDRIALSSKRATEFVDLTASLQKAVEKAGLLNGRVHLQSLHTTLGLAVNENEPLLLADLEAMLKRLVPAEATYLHDDFSLRTAVPDDEPANGHAHARNLLLQPSLTILVEEGELLIGRWQSVFAVELDGPRTRDAADELVQLQLDRFGVPILRVLNDEDHQEGHEGRRGIDDELPGVGEMISRT